MEKTLATITHKRTRQPETITELPDNWQLAMKAQGQDDEDEDVIEESATDRLSIMLSEASGEDRAELKVYKLNQSGEAEFCKSYSPQEFEAGSYDMLRNEFGAGKYRLVLYATSQPSNKFVIRNKTHVTIAAMQNTAVAQQNKPDSGIAQILELMLKQQQSMQEQLISIKAAPPVDPMQNMSMMLGMMAQMKTVMGDDRPRQEKSSISEIVGAIKELRGAADLIMPEKEDKEDDTMGMLKQVTGLITAGMQAKPPQNDVTIAPMPTINAPQFLNAVESTPEPSPQNENQDMNFMAILALRGHLKNLIALAEKNENPQKGADLIYEKLPDELIDLLAGDQWFDLLTQFESECAKFKDWLTKARDLALSQFDAPDEAA